MDIDAVRVLPSYHGVPIIEHGDVDATRQTLHDAAVVIARQLSPPLEFIEIRSSCVDWMSFHVMKGQVGG